MTFKDQIKAAETKAAENKGDTSAATSDTDDIARLLRALNEDLKADSQSTGIDPLDEDDEDEEVAAARSFPLGKVVLALVAAGAVGVAVVMFDGSTPDTAVPVQTAAVAPIGQGGTSASPPPLVQPAKPAGPAQPEALIARAPAAGPAPVPAPVPAAAAPVPPIPAPPGRVEPAPVPPPVLPGAPSGTQTVVKPIEPPVLPKMDAPKPVQTKTAEAKPAEVKPAEPKAPEILKAPEAKAPEAKLAEPKPPEVLKLPEPKAPEANTAELQAMLSPPKGSPPAGKTLKVKPPAAHAEPAIAAPAAPRPAVSATGRWVVQAGSFSVAENAEAVQRKLAAKGYTTQVIDWTDASQRSWKVVRVGGYDTQADARRVAGELKSSLGLSALVVGGR